MNQEGQRPPAAEGSNPEPGNARVPAQPQRQQAEPNGNVAVPNGGQPPGGEGQGQPQGQGGGGRRRFRRQRRGGRGRRGKGGGGGQQPGGGPQVQAPLDAQGRIVDVENDEADDAPGETAPPVSAEAAVPAAEGAAPTEGAAPAAPVPAEGATQPQPRPPGQQQRQPGQQRQQQPRQETLQPAAGVLDVDHRGNGKLRDVRRNFLPQQDDVDVPKYLIDRERLRMGSALEGQAARRNGRLQLVRVEKVDGLPPQLSGARTAFQNLTVIDPDDRLVMETGTKELITRVIDIVSPIGLGQRMLIVSPPKAGKTIMLQKICLAITQNRPSAHQMVLLVDERPEEVTDFKRTVKAEVFASSSDRPTDEHIRVAEMVLARAQRFVEEGKDVVILLDSITRLSRAYNKEVESSGRTLSGGIDSRALEKPKRFFGAARNAEEGGSLTIIATALIDTGSRMDEVIFEEFKGTGNAEINLDRALAEKRIFPAINIQTSGTRKEEKLFSQHEYEKVKKLRGALYALKPVEAMERLLKSLNEFKSNAEFLEAI